MKINYYNDVTREYGDILVKRTNGMTKGHEYTYCYRCRNERGIRVAKIVGTMDEADRAMKGYGYTRVGIVDETGCMRYTMTLPELQGLYKKMEDFVADCTQQEYNENKSAIISVYTLIKKHIDAEIKK